MNEIEKTILLLLLLFCFISIPIITICYSNCNCSCNCNCQKFFRYLKQKMTLKSISKIDYNDYNEIA